MALSNAVAKHVTYCKMRGAAGGYLEEHDFLGFLVIVITSFKPSQARWPVGALRCTVKLEDFSTKLWT